MFGVESVRREAEASAKKKVRDQVIQGMSYDLVKDLELYPKRFYIEEKHVSLSLLAFTQFVFP